MARLYLVRHAKAVAFAPSIDDHGRPLTDRGRRQAGELGEALRASGPIEEVICSTSTRTRETFAGLGLDVAVRFSDALYGGSVDQLITEISTSNAERLLVIGHNPEISALAADLSGPGSEPTAIAMITDRFPTATLAIVEIDGSLAELTAIEPPSSRLVLARLG